MFVLVERNSSGTRHAKQQITIGDTKLHVMSLNGFCSHNVDKKKVGQKVFKAFLVTDVSS
jgi:hypothetical protein